MSRVSVSVGLIGLPEMEERRLQAAFSHSQTRTVAYHAYALDQGPDVLMVNADEPVALIRWQHYRDRLGREAGSEPPTVLVSQNREFKTRHYQVRRPLIASRVICVLDRVTTEALKRNADVAFAADESPPAPAAGDRAAPARAYVALVVDDSLPVRIQMDQALKAFANRVDFAETGEEAFELVNSNDYDIIFLDVVLPGVDGYEVCKVIKMGRAKNTPVIMLTGNSSPADRIKGKLAGCDTYLIKPVSQAVFQEVVRHYLKDARPVSTATA
jgi:twitching motility two-component system response regulator PilG